RAAAGCELFCASPPGPGLRHRRVAQRRRSGTRSVARVAAAGGSVSRLTRRFRRGWSWRPRNTPATSGGSTTRTSETSDVAAMPTSREQAYRALVSLRPPAILLQCYESKKLPENLDIYLGPPEEFFLAPDTQDSYTEGRLIPLLDDGNFGVVTFYDPRTGMFVQKDVESPGEARATFVNWQQYLASVLVQIAESTEDDGRVRRAAELLEFRYIDSLLALLNGSGALNYDRHATAVREY